jgi:hypothetical protein
MPNKRSGKAHHIQELNKKERERNGKSNFNSRRNEQVEAIARTENFPSNLGW